MKKFLLSILVLLVCANIFPCTGFVRIFQDRILIGNNEDNLKTLNDPVVKVFPAEPGRYGCILVGFEQQGFGHGGFNDQGLFYDWFSAPRSNWRSFNSREEFPGFEPEDMLYRCKDVEEAIAFLYRYNLRIFEQNHVFLADTKGNVAAVEWGDDDLVVVRMENDHFAITNFLLNNPSKGGHPCSRYETADSMVQQQPPSVGWYTQILTAVHMNYSTVETRYSNIYELKKGNIYNFDTHNFHESLKFNLTEELDKGRNTYFLTEYLSDITIQGPADNADIEGTTATIRWNGYSNSDYRVIYSKDADFKGSEMIMVVSNSKTLPAFLILFTTVFAAFIFRGRKRTDLLLMLIILSFFLVGASCDDDTANQTMSDFSEVLENLEANTKYFWKIEATRDGNIYSETVTRSFTTGS